MVQDFLTAGHKLRQAYLARLPRINISRTVPSGGVHLYIVPEREGTAVVRTAGLRRVGGWGILTRSALVMGLA